MTESLRFFDRLQVRGGLLLLLGLLLTATADSAVASAAESPSAAPILCIGDSLTYGTGGEGVTYPNVLAARAGIPTVNLGLPGWIPRHIVYYVFLHERPCLTRQQLENIPPSEYEDRKNQPDLNHLRVFLEEGQSVWVRDSNFARATRYRWEGDATVNNLETIKPKAVGDQTHRPITMKGRWRRDVSVTDELPKPVVYRGVILWLGGNGMEATDVIRSVHLLLDELKPPHEHFLLLGLMNRVDTSKEPSSVAPWARWITECNDASRRTFPDHFLDLQAWVTASGVDSTTGYKTRDWIPAATDDQVRRDKADQALGLMPTSLRARELTTHMNAAGYTAIGNSIYDWTSSHGWLEPTR